MLRILITFSMIFSAANMYSQPTAIGTVSQGIAQITVNLNDLYDDWDDELNDGTTFSSAFIEQNDDNVWCLVVTGSDGTNQNRTVTLLSYKTATHELFISAITGSGYKLCVTFDCIDNCNWEVCSCKKTTGECTYSENSFSNGLGYIGSTLYGSY